MLQPDPKRRLSATQVFEVFQKPNAPLRTSLPKIDPIPLNAPGGSQINPLVPGRESVIHPQTERFSRDYNVIVTPPPPANMSNSLSLSTIEQKPSRPPTFNPNSFGNPVVHRNPAPLS